VVDDNSPDRTWELAIAPIPEYPASVRCAQHERRGLASAVIRGWQAAKGRCWED